MRIIELFGGIGACTQALKRLGIEVEVVDYVEIDKYAVASYNTINETNFETQDITKYNKHFDNIDLIIHGSPCQDFSVAGKQAGGDEGSGTRSSLMYETLRIVKDIKPKYVIWENVKNLLSKNHKHNFDNYINMMNEIGYNSYYKILNAKNYGIPQNRERVFTISIRKDIKQDFRFPDPVELKLRLKNMLEDDVDEKYYLSEKMIKFFYHNEQVQKEKGNGFRFGVSDGNVVAKSVTTRAGSRMDDNFIKIINATKKGYVEAIDGDGINLQYPDSTTRRGRIGHQVSQTLMADDSMGVIIGSTQQHAKISKDGIVPTLTSAMGLGGGHVPMHNYDYRIRKLTPKECWRLMGFSDKAFEKAEKVNSNAQLYKQAGNSIVVDVLEKILKNLLGD